jgi:small subunit ribosomal protein S27e
MKNLVEMPESKFVRVACKKCKNEQVIFSKCAMEVRCVNCDELVAESTGGECYVHAKILGTLS